MSFFLNIIGVLMLIVSLGAIALGMYMSTGSKTRRSGVHFAIWWVPGIAAASGVLMRDSVTFVVGMVCFAVAGAAILLQGRTRKKGPSRRRPEGGSSSARTARTGGGKDHRKAAS